MAVAMVVLAAACGSTPASGGHTSPAATGSPRADASLCQDAAALRASLENILSYQAAKEPIARLRADLGDANTKLTALRVTPHGTWSPELTALETALKKLKNEAVNPVLRARPAGIERALADVGPKARSFFAAVKSQCPQL